MLQLKKKAMQKKVNTIHCPKFAIKHIIGTIGNSQFYFCNFAITFKLLKIPIQLHEHRAMTLPWTQKTLVLVGSLCLSLISFMINLFLPVSTLKWDSFLGIKALTKSINVGYYSINFGKYFPSIIPQLFLFICLQIPGVMMCLQPKHLPI